MQDLRGGMTVDDKTIRAEGCEYCQGGRSILSEEETGIHVYEDGHFEVYIDGAVGEGYVSARFNHCPMCGTPLSEEAIAYARLPQEPNEALTLAELATMDGKPVYVEAKIAGTGWKVIDFSTETFVCFTDDTVVHDVRIKNGKDRIYARPPKGEPK